MKGSASGLQAFKNAYVWRKLIPHTNPPSPRTMLEAEARLAEAQLTVLQLRQNMIYQQFTNGLCAGGDVDD